MITSIYRKAISLETRTLIYNFFLGKVLFFIRNFRVIAKSKFTYLFNFILPKNEINQAFSFMGRYGLTSYPYPYMLEYKNRTVDVTYDAGRNLSYVEHNGKKLYFPEFYSTAKIIKDYRALLTEQDVRAAHRYVKDYSDLKDKTLLDVGAAEGIFSLDTIELTKQVIIFECEEHWLKPLQATFEPWKEKVTFVKKYVGDRSEGIFITIDEFLSSKEKNNLFIKMDIEGAEQSALRGATEILRTGKNIQVAICTYHRKNDPEMIKNLLTKHGFTTEFSDGLLYWNKRLSKAVIRGKN